MCLYNDMDDQNQGRLQFADVNTPPLKPKATLHATGKLGFNGDAGEFMGLTGAEVFAVAYDSEEGAMGDLYLVRADRDVPEESRISVKEAGDYYHLPTRNFFEREGVDFERYKLIYDIEETEVEGREAYLLKRREDLRERD